MKRFGIRITLTDDNPMRLPHLLGDDWESLHWYDSEEERDRALAEMSKQLPNYRRGDTPAQVLSKIDEPQSEDRRS